MPGTITDGPTVPMSFSNNFWGRGDAGVYPLLERMQNAKNTCDEVKAFYSARASIEEEYAKKLLALCRKPLGSSESGTLRASLDVVRGEVESMGKAHQSIAGQMRSEIEEPLTAFSGGMKERRKIVQNGVEKLFKTKQQQTSAVNKSRDRYEQDCLKIKGYLAQGHMVMGQEERKNKSKMEKTQIQVASTSTEYESAVKVLEETTKRWKKEWTAACDKFQDLEEERLDFMKSSLWTFANVASTVCVSDDASCEKIRLSLENCEVEKDILSFIQDRGTGQEIPGPPRYIDFRRGDADDAASAQMDEDNYTVAQFQRTINPAFRSSSPQPSTFESHHDPGSDLAARMGHQTTRSSPMGDASLNPQLNAAAPMTKQLKTAHHQNSAQVPLDDLPTVPHNEYPADGMTMFCRTAPPSDRSSAASPNRPSSRDSQSELSIPTSYTSQELSSGQPSPIKEESNRDHYGSSPDKAVQKKRSGFFSNSPFRRKSKHEKEGPGETTPRSRWMGNRNAEHSDASPSKLSMSQNTREGLSGSPEPVDPRAKFQLNIGNNVFDVDSPDARGKKPLLKGLGGVKKDIDPMAAALEELKGVNKQSSVRMSADRYAGVATPGPGSQASTQASEAPPSYSDAPQSRLGAPQPAFTSAQMRKTKQEYVNKTQNMYGTPRSQAPPRGQDVRRAASPQPMRSTSPQPPYQGREKRGLPRSASPNPYGGSRTQPQASGSPEKNRYSRHNSPNDVGGVPPPRAQFARQERPHSSADMHVQLHEGPPQGRPNNRARPMTFYGGPPQQQSQESNPRPRAKSTSDGRKFTADGKPILQMSRAMYMYRAAIPEELSFAKGDILAVTRYQDDGWWEAEVTGKPGRPGLVPSNYLQPC